MGRLILVPQYPAKLRYQEWWFTEFPKYLNAFFDEIIILGQRISEYVIAEESLFAPTDLAIRYETQQIDEYTRLVLKPNDCLLLCDLSFPGLFANVLFHKKPNKCFAICHATSKNKYDYFAKNRGIKYPIEKATAKLFNKVIVGSQYHKEKLKWPNIVVKKLPFPPFRPWESVKWNEIVSVARPGIQKHNLRLERLVEKTFNTKIQTPECNTWDEYYHFLAQSKVLLITSKEETYGYQVIDAILNGCIPIAPNAFSYPELLSKNYLYNNSTELIELITKALNNELKVPTIHDTYFFSKIAYIMKYD